jgi:peroxiredoxin
MPVTVKPGETVKVEYGGGGRQVFGQAMPDNPDLAVDWLNDDHTLTLKQPGLNDKAPNLEDFASYKSYEQARDRYSNSPERLKQARDARTYVLEFERDGSFRADDVPAGTYLLRIVVTKPDEKQQFSAFPDPNAALGSLAREVVVPPGKDSFDLGTLIVPIKGDTGVTKPAPVAFAAQTLDGAAFTLDRFKGKFVLLAFWGGWSERSMEKLKELGKLQADFAQDPRITMLGVSTDEDIGSARKAAEANHFPWEQAWLPPEKLAGVTAAFEVDTLPAVFLLDPDGRIVGRDLEGDRIQAALRRALASK